MGVFDNFQEINGKVIDSSFVQWTHTDIPNSPDILRWIMRVWATLFGHCLKCTALSGCYFAKFNMPGDINSPDGLLHPHCHCFVEDISNPTLKYEVSAVCPIEKFTEYIFADKYAYNGKRELFELLGFTVEDSYELKREFEKQAKEKYMIGDYVLKRLDIFGQNINISIIINKNGRTVEFKSGWKVYPEGLLNCVTPMGDK